MIKIPPGIKLTCAECDTKADHESFLKDKIRMYKTPAGTILCESCFDDYLEKRDENKD